MFEFFKKKPDVEKTVEKVFTINDVTSDIYKQLENEFYANFDFMKLYQPKEEVGLLAQYMPYISTILTFITMIIVWKK